jgi:hypothetical protein
MISTEHTGDNSKLIPPVELSTPTITAGGGRFAFSLTGETDSE